MSAKVVAYKGHIGIVDEKGCTIASVADQGSLQATLEAAYALADGYKSKKEIPSYSFQKQNCDCEIRPCILHNHLEPISKEPSMMDFIGNVNCPCENCTKGKP